MRLTRDERSALLAAYRGERNWPAITRPGAEKCPIAEGEKYRVSALCWLSVKRIRRSAKGDHVIVYDVNRIEQLRYMLPGNHKVKLDAKGEPVAMSVHEEHGYTTDARMALERGVPSVSATDQAVIDMQSHNRTEKRRAQEGLRREQHTLETRLSIARKVAEVKGVDITTHERAIERRLLELERMLQERPSRKAA